MFSKKAIELSLLRRSQTKAYVFITLENSHRRNNVVAQNGPTDGSRIRNARRRGPV